MKGNIYKWLVTVVYWRRLSEHRKFISKLGYLSQWSFDTLKVSIFKCLPCGGDQKLVDCVFICLQHILGWKYHKWIDLKLERKEKFCDDYK